MVETILGLIQKGQWLPLIILLLTLINAWLSDSSKVPITLPAPIRAVVIIVLGQGLGVLSALAAHQPWQSLAVHAGLASIIAISTSHAIWSQDAPAWMKALAGIAQSIEGGDSKKNAAGEAAPPRQE